LRMCVNGGGVETSWLGELRKDRAARGAFETESSIHYELYNVLVLIVKWYKYSNAACTLWKTRVGHPGLVLCRARRDGNPKTQVQKPNLGHRGSRDYSMRDF
jgi:hypothetical protein